MRSIWPAWIGAMLWLMAVVTPLPALGPVAEAPLPSPDSILKRALEQARKEDQAERAFKQRYYFERTRVREFRNAKGDLKSRQEKKSTHDPVAIAARRLAKAAAAKPSPPARPPEADDNEPISDTKTNIKGKAFEKQDFPLTEDLLKRFEFKLVRREPLNGRPALVVDFKPSSRKVPERNLKDKFLNQAAGRIWLDEEDAAVAKADVYLSKKVNVIGGLVGAVWKFTCTMDRERTAEGYWYIRDTKWHLEGRELFIHRTVDSHEQRTGVRPVEADANRPLD